MTAPVFTPPIWQYVTQFHQWFHQHQVEAYVGLGALCAAGLVVKTLKRHQFREFLPYPRDRRRLPTVLSREEVARLIDGAGTLFRRTLLMTLYATGMRRSELACLKVSDIDSQRMILRVVEGKGGKDRDLPLSPALLETLLEYWRWHMPVGPN